jgi:hypothetical protein
VSFRAEMIGVAQRGGIRSDVRSVATVARLATAAGVVPVWPGGWSGSVSAPRRIEVAHGFAKTLLSPLSYGAAAHDNAPGSRTQSRRLVAMTGQRWTVERRRRRGALRGPVGPGAERPVGPRTGR